MTPDTFRLLALSLPNVQFGSSLGNEEFRVGSRVFASLGSPMVGQAVIKLTPHDQGAFATEAPSAFAPRPGGQGARGATIVKLAMVDEAVLRRALAAACRKATKG
ncbi:hypothetical protein [Phenylobacterium sp.]|uniref:hypothetical protein n=1 Tax=Phenylobacterium sp. TaxID=1871053 RepID=UPI00374DC426